MARQCRVNCVMGSSWRRRRGAQERLSNFSSRVSSGNGSQTRISPAKRSWSSSTR